MNKKSVMNFINFHFQKIVICTILIILISIFLYHFIPDYIESERPHDYSGLVDVVYQINEKHPELLEYDEDNTAILKMDALYSVLPNELNPILDPIYNDEFDQCAGYIVVKKNNIGIQNIDISHFCDMIDY